MTQRNILVTGGAEFIGSAVIRYLITDTNHKVANADKLTYVGNLESLTEVSGDDRYRFYQQHIVDYGAMEKIFNEIKPDFVMHLAAESRVDRSITGPTDFVQTNIVGTYILQEVSRKYWTSLGVEQKISFRFYHIPTDEVFGSLGSDGFFTKTSHCDLSPPYSSSKAFSDHLVRVWNRNYGMPVIVTNCSINYGPYQFPEKLIPLMILDAMEGKPLLVYGKGDQIRDWLFVDDHARALYEVVMRGTPGESYNIGGHDEKTNLEVATIIFRVLDEVRQEQPGRVSKYEGLISYVTDRPGHDMRCAIDATEIKEELGWVPQKTCELGIQKTVDWFLNNLNRCAHVVDGNYQCEKLGLLAEASI